MQKIGKSWTNLLLLAVGDSITVWSLLKEKDLSPIRIWNVIMKLPDSIIKIKLQGSKLSIPENYYMNWVKTSWTYSTLFLICFGEDGYYPSIKRQLKRKRRKKEGGWIVSLFVTGQIDMAKRPCWICWKLFAVPNKRNKPKRRRTIKRRIAIYIYIFYGKNHPLIP